MIDITEISKTIDWATECKMDKETRSYFSSREQELEQLYKTLKEEAIRATPCCIEGTFGLSSIESFGEDERKKFESKLKISNFKLVLIAICAFSFIGCITATFAMLIFGIASLGKIFFYGAFVFGFLMPAINPIVDFFTKDEKQAEKTNKKPVLDFRLIEMRKKWCSDSNIAKLENGLKSWIVWKMSTDQEVITDSKELIESHLELKIWLEDGMPMFCFQYKIELT